ncbi:UvrB/UvrC motif-containing protein [Verrucomicrobiales bacterium]|jgi:protein arginine kinase activator|nr:UvrB/UvrC motif-containing protein [Verrucomicrobiales bacterium]MDC0321892.1 UvrB/UvrC motif-containing protein [Verrucomicrobiales bacterium]
MHAVSKLDRVRIILCRNMNCDVCSTEDATLFFSQLVEGKLKRVNLCKSCADEKGVTDPTGFALADMLEGMGEEETVSEVPEQPEELTCKVCGFTQSDFKKTGRFGCSACYEVFNEGLDSLLEAMHKHTEHRGKTPQGFVESGGAPPEEVDRLSELKTNLQASVEAEDYEEAARLRDAISQLESETTIPPKIGDS